MTIIFPGGLLAAGISIYLFYKFNRDKQAKQNERRESLNEKRQQYLHQLIETNKNRQVEDVDHTLTNLRENTASPDKSYQIIFRFYSETLENWTVETLWATAVDVEKGWYSLDNIPFYAKSLACGDVIFAEYDEDEEFLIFRELVTPSGNSTIQIVIMDPSLETNAIRESFKSLGCDSEKFQEGYFVLDVPADLSYSSVKALLAELFDKGAIDYAEACLSNKHREEGAQRKR